MADARFREIPARFRDGRIGTARATGNNAAWLCPVMTSCRCWRRRFAVLTHSVFQRPLPKRAWLDSRYSCRGNRVGLSRPSGARRRNGNHAPLGRMGKVFS